MLYAQGGQAGFTPQQVREMSFFDFYWSCKGWRMANVAEEEQAAKAPSIDEFKAFMEREGGKV